MAESFGDIDPKIDGREDVIEEGMAFTGFHRLEKDLWVTGLQPDSNAIADQLMSDIEDLANRAKTVELTPLQLANGAKELLDEVATGKITGEEDRYSHTDLWDFRSNVDGSQAAIASLRPVIEERDPDLLATLDEKFAAVDAVLEKHRVGDGFKLYTGADAGRHQGDVRGGRRSRRADQPGGRGGGRTVTPLAAPVARRGRVPAPRWPARAPPRACWRTRR